MNEKGYKMYVAKWGGVVTAQKVVTPRGYANLMRNAKTRYVCTDDFGWDLYEHCETGDLYVTNLSWSDCPDDIVYGRRAR